MISLVSAPTNLGLRPPGPGRTPGTWRAPGALRAAGVLERMRGRAVDGGVVAPGPYVDDDATRAPDVVRNQDALVAFSRQLAVHLREVLARGDALLVLGGDCSLLLAAGLAVADRPGTGLVHLDGHTDFRHPGNSDACASVAGEDLAVAVGRHRPTIADVDGHGPYFAADRVAHVGCREDDAHLEEATSVLGLVVPARRVLDQGAVATARRTAAVTGDGFWLQLDVDVLDPAWMPAVDSPNPGGLDPDTLVALLRALAPRAVGAAVTVFDPELDPDGWYAALLVDVVDAGLGGLGSSLDR